MIDNRKVFLATKWSIVCEVIAKIIAPVTTIVLARLLSQEIFGIVASLTAVTSMADMLADAGFNAYIVQHQFKTEQERKGVLDICFWTSIIIAIVLFAIIVINRDVFSKLVGADGYGNVLAVMAVVIPLVSISSIEMAVMKKDLNFKSLGLIRITSKLMPLCVTVPLALLGLGYWSLVVGSLAGEFVGMVLSLFYGKFWPGLSYPLQYLKSIFSFSLWAYLESILEWFIANVSILVLATIYGMAALGIFKVAVNLVTQITSSIYSLYANVYKSAIAKEQDHPGEFKNIFLTFQKLFSVLSLPLGALVFVYRDLVTRLLLGDEWMAASTLIGFYCLTCTCSIAFGNFYSDAIRAKGYPSRLVCIDAVYLGLVIGLIGTASKMPFVAFCILFSLIKIIQPILQILVGRKICDISFADVLKNSYPQIVWSVVIASVAVLGGFTAFVPLKGMASVIGLLVVYALAICASSRERAFYKNVIGTLLKR